MPVVDLYFYRNRPQPNALDVVVYDSLPEPLRVQISMIMRDTIGGYGSDYDLLARRYWDAIHSVVCRELGRDSLTSARLQSAEDILRFVRTGENVEEVLGVVEATFRLIENVHTKKTSSELKYLGSKQEPADAIREINQKFQRAGVGYQFAQGNIFRVDSGQVHREIVLPTLKFLSDPRFAGADDEFRSPSTLSIG